jgi:hypothetical protein
LLHIFGVVRSIQVFEVIIFALAIHKDCVVNPAEVLRPLFRVIVGRLPLPNNLIDERGLTKNLIEQNLNVVAGMPIAVIVEASSWLENTRQLDHSGSHEVDVCLRRFVAVVKRSSLPFLLPKDFVAAAGVEWRVDVDEINAAIGKTLQLVQIVSTVHDLGID